MVLRYGPITNGQLHDTGRQLCRWLSDSACARVAFASGYVSLAGLKCLQPSLKELISREDVLVRVLTGIKDYFTEPDALVYLHRLARRADGRFSVRLSRNLRFHAKCYLFDIAKKAKAVIGSANLTTGGMSIDGELSVQIETECRDPS